MFPQISKRKGVDDSDLYYFKDKGSVNLTRELEALGRTLLSGAIGCCEYNKHRTNIKIEVT